MIVLRGLHSSRMIDSHQGSTQLVFKSVSSAVDKSVYLKANLTRTEFSLPSIYR